MGVVAIEGGSTANSIVDGECIADGSGAGESINQVGGAVFGDSGGRNR